MYVNLTTVQLSRVTRFNITITKETCRFSSNSSTRKRITLHCQKFGVAQATPDKTTVLHREMVSNDKALD